jgi:hypothetical protein
LKKKEKKKKKTKKKEQEQMIGDDHVTPPPTSPPSRRYDFSPSKLYSTVYILLNTQSTCVCSIDLHWQGNKSVARVSLRVPDIFIHIYLYLSQSLSLYFVSCRLH